ncbi:MAG: FAD-dependent monooxygenase [Ahniella sp.]|nr:FAD-dependent monooxygenase [Ahniella sp.]
MNESVDVVIVGSGLVGASLSIALAGSGRKVLQIEASPEQALVERWDERHFVLAEASRLALERIGVWPRISVKTPITRILGHRAGEFGRLEFRADQYQVPALGYTVPASRLHAALRDGLAAAAGLERWQPARVTGMRQTNDGVLLDVEREGVSQTVRTALVAAADGAQSSLRALAGIGAREIDYRQTAVVAALRPAAAEPGLAYERLTASGPMAILPVDSQRLGLIYTLPADEAPILQQLSDAAFLERLRLDLRDRLGRMTGVGARQLWPLKLTLADRLIGERFVLIGNAAQSIHTLGAQGFNLGLRDAMALAKVLCADQDDAGAAKRLDLYARGRAEDRDQTVRMSHGLVRMTASDTLPHQLFRFAAMTALTHVPALRQRLALGAMGFR